MKETTNNENSDTPLEWKVAISGVAVSAVGMGMMAVGLNNSKYQGLGALGGFLTQAGGNAVMCAGIYGLINSQHQGTLQEAPALERH